MAKNNHIGTTYTKTSLQAGKAYRFRVTARNAEGYSDFSEEIEIYAAVLPDAPLNFANDVD